VALLAGTLGQGGAEKQLFHIATALQLAGVDVRVYALTRGEYYEAALKSSGIAPIWIGRFGSPLVRLVSLTSSLLDFRPHIVQAVHFFTNLYAAISAKLCRAISIGGIRNDIAFERDQNGRWWPWLFRMPSALLANSSAAAGHARDLGRFSRQVRVLPNVIDLAAFDRQAASADSRPPETGLRIIAVGRLVRAKRQDRFLRALASVRERNPEVRGVVVGGGPMRSELVSLASSMRLLPDGVQFVGRSDNVATLLRQCQAFVLTSDYEGFPNVLLEAMAARLPVVTTPAGDSADVVQDDRTGYVVGFEDFKGLVDRIALLARSPEMRQRFGEAGRKRVEEQYGFEHLPKRLLAIYSEIAVEKARKHLLRRIDLCANSQESGRISSDTSVGNEADTANPYGATDRRPVAE
jgi:glycosyltransferase involved in cell wall biosynthesis